VRRDNITAARVILGDKYLDATGQRRFAYKCEAEEVARALADLGVTVAVVPESRASKGE